MDLDMDMNWVSCGGYQYLYPKGVCDGHKERDYYGAQFCYMLRKGEEENQYLLEAIGE